MKLDKSSVDVGSTKPCDRKKINTRRLLKESNVPLSAMKYMTQNEFNSLSVGTHLTIFGQVNI